MNPVQIKSSEYLDLVLFEFSIQGGVCSPEDLKSLDFPPIPRGKGVVISGRGPVWLFGALVHHFHPTPFVATFDPNQNGGVIVQSHSKNWAVGDVIPVPQPE